MDRSHADWGDCESCWEAIPEHFATTELDAFVSCRTSARHRGPLAPMASSARHGMPCPYGGRCPKHAYDGRRAFRSASRGSIPTIVRSSRRRSRKPSTMITVGARHAVPSLSSIGLSPGRITTTLAIKLPRTRRSQTNASLDPCGLIAANPARWVEDSLHPDNPDAPIFSDLGPHARNLIAASLGPCMTRPV